MKERMREFWNKIKNPPKWARILVFLLTLISIGGAIGILFIDYDKSALSILAYALFGLAGITLSYSVYLIVLSVPTIRKNIIRILEKNTFTKRLLKNFGFRVVIFAIFSFVISVVFSVFNAYMGIMNCSVWYGALSAYYIILALLRGGILMHHKSQIDKNEVDEISDKLNKVKTYRNSGIILLILNVTLSAVIGQMIFSQAHFAYVGLTIFAYATYAFYKITMSIINLVRSKKEDDYIVKAIVNVNLADATVAVLALQTALLTMFSDETIDISLMNTCTGIAVSTILLTIGIYMIISASAQMKNIKGKALSEENNDE